MIVSAPISVGELLDKIAILEIKFERIADAAKRANVERELGLLRALAAELGAPNLDDACASLKAVNERLWDVEDRLREHEAGADFGREFVALARSVYELNDRRAELKREINLRVGSTIVEEKSYFGLHAEAAESTR